jgi:signal transduction histidine kinase
MKYILVACAAIFFYQSMLMFIDYRNRKDSKIFEAMLFTFFSAIHAFLFYFYDGNAFVDGVFIHKIIPVHFVASYSAYYYYLRSIKNYTGVQSVWLDRVIKLNLWLMVVMMIVGIYSIVSEHHILFDRLAEPRNSPLPYAFLKYFKISIFAKFLHGLSRLALAAGLIIIIRNCRILRDKYIIAGIFMTFLILAHNIYVVNFRTEYFIALVPIMNFIEIARFNYLIQKGDKLELDRIKERVDSMDKSMNRHHKLVQIGQDTAAIIHDLVNPAQVIDLRLELILKKADVFSKEKILAEMAKLKETNKRLIELLRQSKQRYLKEDQVTELNLVDVVKGAIGLAEHRVFINDISVLNMVDQDVYVQGIHIRLLQVITNILNNACDEIANDEERWIKISLDVEGLTARLKIANSGPKMPEGIAKQVFDPFFSTKQEKDGSGFGLSICKQYMEQMDGEIFVNLTGEFTQFDIEFKLVEQEQLLKSS